MHVHGIYTNTFNVEEDCLYAHHCYNLIVAKV